MYRAIYRVGGILAVLLLLATQCLSAQTSKSDERDQEIQEMRARIARLERLVEDLQLERESQGKAESAQPSTINAAANAPIVPTQEALKSISTNRSAAPMLMDEHSMGQNSTIGQNSTSSGVEQDYPALHFRGFGNVNFSATDDPATKSGFNMGQFILHIASPLSRKVAVFGELSFTAAPTGFTLDVERYLIRYDFNDYFKVSFGRYHTPINYWNTAFHHGLWLQTTIDRPEMIRFGGRFQPVHFVGMLAEGNLPSGPLGLGYNAGVGNGRAGSIGRPGDSGDINNNRAWVVNLFSRPVAFNGLQVGGALYGDEVSPSPALTGNPQFRELISSAHIAWTKETPEFLTEFAHVRHESTLNNAVFNSQAAYAQLAYRLPGFAHKWKPYYRFDWSNISAGDPLFNVSDTTVAVRPLRGSTVGVRYDIINLAAFKIEYRHTARKVTDPVVNGLFFQTAFTF